jgi:PIN domain nuclease of toxin-antitoxin system
MSSAVLDSWAVLAVLNDEPAAARVQPIIDDGGAVMSWINLGEVYYQTIRRRDERRARTAVDAIRRQLRVEEPDREIVLAAARVKANGKMSYADAFCVATAQRHRLPIYTGDPEILRFDASPLRLVDLRNER